MKSVIALVVSAFALTAFAAEAPKATEAAKPVVVTPAKEVKKATPPAKSEAPAVKDTKATVPATK